MAAIFKRSPTTVLLLFSETKGLCVPLKLQKSDYWSNQTACV